MVLSFLEEFLSLNPEDFMSQLIATKAQIKKVLKDIVIDGKYDDYEFGHCTVCKASGFIKELCFPPMDWSKHQKGYLKHKKSCTHSP